MDPCHSPINNNNNNNIKEDTLSSCRTNRHQESSMDKFHVRISLGGCTYVLWNSSYITVSDMAPVLLLVETTGKSKKFYAGLCA